MLLIKVGKSSKFRPLRFTAKKMFESFSPHSSSKGYREAKFPKPRNYVIRDAFPTSDAFVREEGRLTLEQVRDFSQIPLEKLYLSVKKGKHPEKIYP